MVFPAEGKLGLGSVSAYVIVRVVLEIISEIFYVY